jgi:arginine N-succinyltransferase
MRLLLKEGFKTSDSVDVFDAGPMIRARLDILRTSRSLPVVAIRRTSLKSSPDASPGGIVFRRALDFRAILTASSPDEAGAIELSDDDLRKLEHPEPQELAFYPFA